MTNLELDYSDIADIFKEKLKVNNIVKTISSVFLNERYSRKINYKPYFQRNYVWDNDKASYFIESILLGTEVPPLVLFQTTKDKNEVIDGRQRYETIERFLKDKFALSNNGLHCLKSLSGKKYSQLDNELKEYFEDTRIRILQFQVVSEPKLEEEKEDKIKKEIFRRYNSGITPLSKEEIERATYIEDNLTKQFLTVLSDNEDLFNMSCRFFLPIRKRNLSKRDKLNVLIMNIRNLITLSLIPIYNYAHASSKQDILRHFYKKYISLKEPHEEITKYATIVRMINVIEDQLIINKHELAQNGLLYETLYWCINIYLSHSPEVNISHEQLLTISDSIISNSNKSEYWLHVTKPKDTEFSINDLFQATGSHYYSAINNRYNYISNIFSDSLNFDYSNYLKNDSDNKINVSTESSNDDIDRYKLNKPLPETLTIEDIISDMKKDRFLIRPDYQRSEVKNIPKSSYLLESIMLGINIPPIFIYKRDDKIKEVVDGQQRLLSILGFLGRTYKDENGNIVSSLKDKFKLSKLRILTELNGLNIDSIPEEFEDKILEFPLDVIEIDSTLNPEFSQTDLFSRLNSKPYPIKENTFEMWNAYIDKDIILKIREIATQYENKIFKAKDTRMKVEELITTLSYLDFKTNEEHSEFTNVLNIYKRYNRLCARIMSKESVTKTLIDASNKNPTNFIKSVESVKNFINKIYILINDDLSRLPNLFAHVRKRTSFKTDQNFYILWMVLYNLDLDVLKENQSFFFDRIRELFNLLQNVPENMDVDELLKKISNIKSEYESEYLTV